MPPSRLALLLELAILPFALVARRTPVKTLAEVIRRVGVSEQTFYRWKRFTVGLAWRAAAGDEAGEYMPGAAVLDLNDVVDGQKLGRGAVLFLVAAMLALIGDGYNLSVMGYIFPELGKLWRLPPVNFVPASQSAYIIGMFFGAPLLGFFGDRHGRKRVIVFGLLGLGLSILSIAAVGSVRQLAVLLFFAGLTLGGVIPNVAALVAEVTPRRVRGRMLVIVTMGMVIGIALPGLVTAALGARSDWHLLLFIGGVLPIAVAAAGVFAIPESIKYLLQQGGRENEARTIARRLRPDLAIDDDTWFALPAAARTAARGTPKQLFAGDFALVTPMLWICQAANQMANFFSLTWLPTLLRSAGASATQAGATAALFSIGGLIGGVLLLALIDALGIAPLVLMFFIGAPLVAAMALTEMSPALHALIIFGAGFCVLGIQLGLTALLGIFYPTPIRSMGTGWTQAAGRLGGLLAPIAGAVLLTMRIPMDQLPLAPAVLLVIGGFACVTLAVICRRRFGGFHPEEFAIVEASVHPVLGSSAELIA